MIGTVQTQKIFFAMGTVNTITVFEEADEALSAAKERVKDLDLKLSAYSHDSEIYSINSCAGIAPVEVSIDTFKLIKHSVMYSKLTDGLFDITSRPLSQLWKNAIRCGQLPDISTLNEARKLVNYKDIILDYKKRTVRLCVKWDRKKSSGPRFLCKKSVPKDAFPFIQKQARFRYTGRRSEKRP